MNDLRKAAQQALEALEEACGNRCNAEYNPCYRRAAADNLRAALAQPEKTNQCAETCERAKLCAVCASGVDDVNPEPMLWMMPDGKIVDKWALQFYGGQAGEPLYKAPLKRNPLTEDELETAYRAIWRNLPEDFNYAAYGWIEQGIRYAERKHGIGGEE